MVYLHPQLAALFLLTVAVALPQLYNQDPSDWIEPDQPNGEDQYVTDVAFAPPIQIAPTDAVNPNIMDGTNHALDSIVPDDTFNLDGPTYSANLFASLPADPIASTSDHCLPYKQELCCKGKVITLPEDDVDGKIQIGDCHKCSYPSPP